MVVMGARRFTIEDVRARRREILRILNARGVTNSRVPRDAVVL
jgi:hypothetical protein